MAETKKTSGEDQTGNPVDSTDLQKQFDELNKRNKELEDQMAEQQKVNAELQNQLKDQQEITQDMPVVKVGSTNYNIRKGTWRVKYKGQYRTVSAEDVKEDADLAKFLVEKESGFLYKKSSKSK